MPTQEDLQKLYVGFYGRPADMGGISFWAGEWEQLDQKYENDPYKLVKAFADSEETEERGLFEEDDEALVNTIYQNLFGREADEEGLSFYTDKLDAGELDQYTVVYSIINGARGDDVDVMQNKQTVADYFTNRIAEERKKYTREDIPDAQGVIQGRILDGSDVAEAKNKADAVIKDLEETAELETVDAGFDTTTGEGIADGVRADEADNFIILSQNAHTDDAILDGVGGSNTLEFGASEPYDLTDVETFDNIDTIDTENVAERLRLADTHVETLAQNWLADDTGVTLQQAADSDTVTIGYLVRSDIAANGYDGRIEAGRINDEGFNTVIANPAGAIDDDNDAFHGDTFTAYENLALEGAYAGVPGHDNTRGTNDETVIAGDGYADVAPGGLMDVNEKNVSIDGLFVRYDSIGVWEEDLADVHGTIEIEPWGNNYADGSTEGSAVQNTIVERVGGDSGWQGARAIGIRESDIGIEDNRVLGSDGNGGRSPGNGILVTDGRYPDDIEDYFDDIDPEDAANDVEEVTVAGNEITNFDTAAVALFDKHLLEAELSVSVEDNDITGSNRGVALYGDDLLPFTGQADISGNRFSDNDETGIWITGAGTWIDTEKKPAEILIEENAFHDGTDAVRIGGQYDHGTISIANNELTANGSGTSSIAFGHDFSYGFNGTGTIEFDPVEDGVLADNTFDFRKLDGIGGSTVIITEEVDTLADIQDGATGFFDDIADENIVIQTDGTDSRIFVNGPESDQGDKGDDLVESDLQVDVTGVSDLDQFEDAIVMDAYFMITDIDIDPPSATDQPIAEITATIVNTGGHEDTQDVELEVWDGTYMVYEDEAPLSLEVGEAGTVTFTEKAEEPMTGYYDVVISTEDDMQSERVEWPEENINDNDIELMGVEQEGGLLGFDEGL